MSSSSQTAALEVPEHTEGNSSENKITELLTVAGALPSEQFPPAPLVIGLSVSELTLFPGQRRN